MHREVATALAAGVPVLPLLLDDTPMPSPAELPADLQALTGRHALGLDHRRFAADIDRLVTALQTWVPLAAAAPAVPAAAQAGPAAATTRGLSRRSVLLGAGIAALAAGTWWLVARQPGSGTAADDSAAAAAAGQGRAAINGPWIADVPYAWLPEPKRERFVFSGDGARVIGTASFLGVDRLVQEGRFEAGEGLQFVVQTSEMAGSALREVLHRYRGVLQPDGLHFQLQTEGASQPHAPLRFIARRAAPATVPAAASSER